MNALRDELATNPMDLTLEVRFSNGTSTEFYGTDEEDIRETLRLLSTPRLFAQPHLLLASEHCASLVPCRGIDMLLAHTSVRSPLKFPLDLPEGLFDLVEQLVVWPDSGPAANKKRGGQKSRGGQQEQSHRRNSQVEIYTLGGWAVALEMAAMFRGGAQDERQFLSHLPNMPTIPFRLEEGGFGLINTQNIMRVRACPKPEMLPGAVLPLALRQ